MAGRQLRDPGEHGPRWWNIKVSEVIIQGDVIHLPPDLRIDQQRLDLRGEEEPISRLGPVKRLDAYRVASQEQPLPALVPDGEGKHSAKVPHAVGAVLLIGMQ